mmetsp:Transcript_77174/g.223336  ORF Transcript_77174/g.223336 Transcript_77174/m.223336 type:complete len:230 (-) Transcript_77174:1378-2067(-)
MCAGSVPPSPARSGTGRRTSERWPPRTVGTTTASSARGCSPSRNHHASETSDPLSAPATLLGRCCRRQRAWTCARRSAGSATGQSSAATWATLHPRRHPKLPGEKQRRIRSGRSGSPTPKRRARAKRRSCRNRWPPPAPPRPHPRHPPPPRNLSASLGRRATKARALSRRMRWRPSRGPVTPSKRRKSPWCRRRHWARTWRLATGRLSRPCLVCPAAPCSCACRGALPA